MPFIVPALGACQKAGPPPTVYEGHSGRNRTEWCEGEVIGGGLLATLRLAVTGRFAFCPRFSGYTRVAFYSKGSHGGFAPAVLAEGAGSLSNVLAGDPRVVAVTPASAHLTKGPLGGPRAAGAEWNMRADSWEWEPAFFGIYGVSAEEIVPSGPALLAMKHPDDLAMATTLLHAVPRGEEFSLTHRIFRQDGFVRFINTRSLIDTDSKGRPALLHASVDVLSDWKLPLQTGDVPTASDGELMLCFRAQMPEAMAEAFQRHRSRMIGIVLHLYAAVDPEDIIQDVFEELFRKPQGFDARRGSLATYLNMHTRSRCLDVGRSQTKRRRREKLVGYRDAGQPVEDEALLGLSDFAVRVALAGLPQRERVPIELAYLSGLTYRAVGEQLGIPEGTAKARIRRGLQRLQSASALETKNAQNG
jgi:RNA polymerase sigma-70 factor, ECF subfamily